MIVNIETSDPENVDAAEVLALLSTTWMVTSVTVNGEDVASI